MHSGINYENIFINIYKNIRLGLFMFLTLEKRQKADIIILKEIILDLKEYCK